MDEPGGLAAPATGTARVEGLTLGLILGCYGVWGLALFGLAGLSVPLAVVLLGVIIAFHASLSHEAIHGHPFASARLNALLMAPALALVVPYARFRDTHLAHHRDEHLTDPYDDPESNYLDPARWAGLSRPAKALLRANNTLVGRMVLGPVIGTLVWLRGDLAAIRAGDRGVIAGWLAHVPALALVLGLVRLSPMSLGAYALAAYLGLSLLKVRTFLEHRAHEKARARTVIIEDRGPLALLFLNNNLHVVHHMHPAVPWHRLPALYHANRDHYLRRNAGYRYPSYAQVFRQHLLRAKDPVPHPLWPQE
jgi:fatty acid desaturase